jgi:hypothetical protein
MLKPPRRNGFDALLADLGTSFDAVYGAAKARAAGAAVSPPPPAAPAPPPGWEEITPETISGRPGEDDDSRRQEANTFFNGGPPTCAGRSPGGARTWTGCSSANGPPARGKPAGRP